MSLPLLLRLFVVQHCGMEKICLVANHTLHFNSKVRLFICTEIPHYVLIWVTQTYCHHCTYYPPYHTRISLNLLDWCWMIQSVCLQMKFTGVLFMICLVMMGWSWRKTLRYPFYLMWWMVWNTYIILILDITEISHLNAAFLIQNLLVKLEIIG